MRVCVYVRVREKVPTIRSLLSTNFFHFELNFGISIKKIRLFCSNVVVSLRRALFVDALGKNLLIR